jgi:hypothetical protein
MPRLPAVIERRVSKLDLSNSCSLVRTSIWTYDRDCASVCRLVSQVLDSTPVGVRFIGVTWRGPMIAKLRPQAARVTGQGRAMHTKLARYGKTVVNSGASGASAVALRTGLRDGRRTTRDAWEVHTRVIA